MQTHAHPTPNVLDAASIQFQPFVPCASKPSVMTHFPNAVLGRVDTRNARDCSSRLTTRDLEAQPKRQSFAVESSKFIVLNRVFRIQFSLEVNMAQVSVNVLSAKLFLAPQRA
jgi:hypothetical protein